MIIFNNFKVSFIVNNSELSVVEWLGYSPCKPWVVGLIPGFSSFSDETKSRFSLRMT